MMTPLKLKRLLEKHPNSKSFEELNFEYTDPFDDESLVLNGFGDIYTFFYENDRSWVRLIEENSGILSFQDFRTSHEWHKLCYEEILRIIKMLPNIEDLSIFNKVFSQSEFHDNNRGFSGYMHAKLPKVKFLADLFIRNGELEVSGALTYYKYRNYTNFNINEPQFLKGYFLAMQFENQEEFKLVLKKETYYDKYKLEIGKISDEGQQLLLSQKELLDENEELLKNLIAEKKASLSLLEGDYRVTHSDFDSLKSKMFNSLKSKFDNQFETAAKKHQDLEELYGEKLAFEKPADLWSTRANDSFKRANILLTVFAILLVFFSWCLYQILMEVPSGVYASFMKGKDHSAAIRWSIIFVTFISFGAFGLRNILKAMFSAFHIARDCNERHALTNFYLSLLKSGSIEKEQRSLVMQSLFSRTDTGLLKDDNGPTMPTEIKAFTGKT
jgi:hypothetical protein